MWTLAPVNFSTASSASAIAFGSALRSSASKVIRSPLASGLWKL
jgi:hypothetical protein